MERRNLSGFTINIVNENNESENIPFEQLSREQMVSVLDEKEPSWLKAFIIYLSEILREIGEQLNIEVVYANKTESNED